MRRTRLSMKNLKAVKEISSDEDSSNDAAHLEFEIKTTTKKKIISNRCDLSESSSDSDIQTCVKPPRELNLDSSFYARKQTSPASDSNFEAIEAGIFSGINRLSESESETEITEIPLGIENFKDIQLYNSKLDDAKKSIEKYEAKRQTGSTSLDINHLLAAGEKVAEECQRGFSDYEDYSDEQEDWEEIKNENRPENLDSANTIKDVEITVEMPGIIAKKKGVDLLASIKRRINRVKKEQQVYVHKVHLLCWIAHGNYVNKVLNRESVQAIALSLLPSQHCYPSSRVDLSYLEQILTWFRKTIKNLEQTSNNDMSLEESLQHQMRIKETHDKNVFVYIFICILRSLGINVRLVMNLVVESLRPANSELCSLSNKPSTSTAKESNQESVVPISKTENKDSNLSPSVTALKDKPVTLASKLHKLTNCTSGSNRTTSSSSELKLKTNDTFHSDKEAPKTDTISIPSKKQNSKSKVKTMKEQSRTADSVNKKLPVLSKSKSETEKNLGSKESSAKSSKTSGIIGKLSEKKDVRSRSKSSKDGERTRQSKKRLLERSENIPATNGNSSDLGSTSKQGSKSQIRSDCEIIDLAVKRNNDKESEKGIKNTEILSKSRKQSAGKEAVRVKATSSSIGIKDESKKNICKRTSTLSKTTNKVDNPRGGKKRKQTVAQLDGLHDFSGDSDYNENLSYDNNPLTIPQLDGNDSSGSETKTKPNLRKLSTRSQTSKAEGSYKKGTNESLKALQKSNERTKSIFSSSQSSYFSSPDKKVEKKSTDVRSDIINLVSSRITQEKQKRTSGRNRQTKSVRAEADSDSDSDFVPVSSEKKKPRNDDSAPKMKVKRRVLPRKELDKLADDENSEKKTKGVDIWVEVFLEAEEKWISVDVLKGQVHCVKEIYSRASHPISYILSWDNNNYVKDVTQRYCTTNWNTITRKLRVEPEWWSPTLKPFVGPKTARQLEEDEELEQQQMDQPLPKAISEYKNHPLYALKRHLLKFEAIYPAEAPALGFVRNEPVYSRLCVHTLHSREIWVKHAKVVKPGETAYKIVKARPKYDRHSNTFTTDLPLEIFGSWQVNDYEPPTAENGIVPKNAYGNVELFKKCMLPKGTVHMDLPGLQKVGRKLNIDCPPAVVGFDFHGGWSHPTFEGFVVCEEFVEILTAAWYQEQEEVEKRELEKIDKRVYGNWRKLLKGLLIRERLQKRYDFAQPSTSGQKKSKLVLKKNRRLVSDSESSDSV